MEFDVVKVRRVMAEIGLALAPTSIALGMIAKLLAGNMFLGNLLMAMGLLMAFPFHRLLERVSLNKLIGIMFFLLLAFVYYFVSKYDDTNFLVYMGVSLFYCVSLLFSKYDEDFNLNNVINYLWLFSLIFVLGGFASFATGKINILENVMAWNDEGDKIYDGLTMGSMAITQIVCSCHLLSKERFGKKVKALLLLAVFLDFVLIIFTVKRTPLLIAMVAVLIYFKRLGYLRPTPQKIIAISIITVAILAYVVSNSEIMDALMLLIDETVTGLGNLLSGNHTGHGLTNSTDMRLDNRDYAFELLRNFDVLNVCIGTGYMTFWCDIPLLQAFLDMGLIGFVFYAFYILFLPLWTLFKYRNNATLFFYGMLAIYGALSCVTSGHPYANARWMPVCLLCYAICASQKEGIKELEITTEDEALHNI